VADNFVIFSYVSNPQVIGRRAIKSTQGLKGFHLFSSFGQRQGLARRRVLAFFNVTKKAYARFWLVASLFRPCRQFISALSPVS
jgi:hypothetical protein